MQSFRSAVFHAIMLIMLLPVLFSSCQQSRSSDTGMKEGETYEWEHPPVFNSAQQRLAHAIDTFFAHKVTHSLFNGCVLVADSGKILFQKCYGVSNHETSLPLSDTSTFQLASVTKPFTATAILILAEEGKLQLDQPVARYLRHFPYDSITIRMLLTHRSGLPNYLYLPDAFSSSDSLISNRQLLNYFIEEQPPLDNLPGHHFEYCNTNYALLASVIEDVSGESYESFLQEKIFTPAHMHHSYICLGCAAEEHPSQTTDYFNSHWKKARTIPFDGVAGDKGIYSTPYDLYLFDQALNHHLLLSQETLDAAYKGYSYEKPGIKNYGLGWRLKEYPSGETLVYHNGWWRGYNTLFDREPERGLCIVVLSNKFNRSTYDLHALFSLMHINALPGDAAGD